MSENKKREKLFQEFEPVSTKEWESKIHQDLKGKSYEKKLIWKTPEGFNVRPYYRAEDLENLDYVGVKPGEYPFVRGNKTNHNNWYIRQDIEVKDFARANAKALEILNKGVNSIGFVLGEETEVSEEDLDTLLRDICTEAIELNFSGGKDPAALLELFLKKAKADGANAENLHASVDYAPLAYLVTRGGFYEGSKDKAFDTAARLAKASRGYPNVKVIGIHGEHYHNAGATLVQELGFALAEGARYMTALTERGLRADHALQSLKFNFSVGSVYFMEIAKVRAARMLWAKVAEAYQPEDTLNARMNIHSITSEWNKTVYDPYVNMIRTSTEAMSAVIGGVESLTVEPYDKIFRKPSEFSERIARNQQIILKEESHFDHVADPAGGAYYVENLTSALADNAWKIFLETNNAGGPTEAFKQGIIQDKVKESAQNRDMNLATRRKILLGTNQYANLKEAMDEDIAESIVRPQQPKPAAQKLAAPIVPYRGAMKFEAMRLKTDRSSKTPKVFMLKVGNPAMRTARSQFASNFFGCAGYEILDNLGFNSVEEGVQEAKKQEADIVVICSSDQEYETVAPEAYKALKDEAIVVLAGYPRNLIETLQETGMQHFIHLKSNLYDTLMQFQQLLGIE